MTDPIQPPKPSTVELAAARLAASNGPVAPATSAACGMPRRRATDPKMDDAIAPKPIVHMIDPAHAAQNALLLPGAAPCAETEAFRTAKRALIREAFAAPGQESARTSRAILVGSANPGEGKTHCALNLALSMATDRTLDILLIDADSLRGDVAARLGIPKGPGLMDALVKGIPPEQFIVPTSIGNFSVLPAGAPSREDSELLGSAVMAQFIRRTLQAALKRLIIVDTAPLLATASAPSLAVHCGQVVLVVRADSTTEEDVGAALDFLSAPVRIQLLLNRMTFRAGITSYPAYAVAGQ